MITNQSIHCLLFLPPFFLLLVDIRELRTGQKKKRPLRAPHNRCIRSQEWKRVLVQPLFKIGGFSGFQLGSWNSRYRGILLKEKTTTTTRRRGEGEKKSSSYSPRNLICTYSFIHSIFFGSSYHFLLELLSNWRQAGRVPYRQHKRFPSPSSNFNLAGKYSSSIIKCPMIPTKKKNEDGKSEHTHSLSLCLHRSLQRSRMIRWSTGLERFAQHESLRYLYPKHLYTP